MADDSDLRRDLLWRIEARRAAVQAFLRTHRPRTRRRTTLTLVLSSLAALFTAGPALGGATFAGSVQNALDLRSESYVWRILCLLALLVSVGAAVLTNISKAHDDVGRLSTAEAANAELEGLSSLLQYGHLTVEDAVKLYQQYSVKIPFIDDPPTAQPSAPLEGWPAHRAAPPPASERYAPPPPTGNYPPPPPR